MIHGIRLSCSMQRNVFIHLIVYTFLLTGLNPFDLVFNFSIIPFGKPYQ